MPNINDLFSSPTTNSRPSPATLTGVKAIGATSITVDSTTGWETDNAVHFVIYEVDANNEKVAGTQCDFKGIVNSATSINNVTLKAGTDREYSIGAKVVCAPTGAWADDLVNGIRLEHNQDGTHSDITATSVTATTGTFTNLTVGGSQTGAGWQPLGIAQSGTIVNNGNRSYDIPFASTVADVLTPGMRLRIPRTVAAPTQCADLERDNSQYFSKTSPTGITFTDDFVCSAWIKLESYANGGIISRYNGTSGWIFDVLGDGTIRLRAANAAAANFSQVLSYQSIPLNKWVHVAAQLDMSTFTATPTTSYVMIDGVNVPAVVSRGGTNPTALVQAGNLEVGSYNATNYFDGKIAQASVHSAKLTQDQVRAMMTQTISSSSPSIVAGYTLNNSLADVSANANDLTASGGALATNADAPFGINANGVTGSYEYGIVTKVATTTATVQFPEGSCPPTSGGVGSIDYSTQSAPFGFPRDGGRWRVNMLNNTLVFSTSNATFGAFNSGGHSLTVPVGAWNVGWYGSLQNSSTTTVVFSMWSTALTGLSIAAASLLSPYSMAVKSSAAANYINNGFVEDNQIHDTPKTYVLYSFGATTSAALDGATGKVEIFAECNYL